MFLSFFTKYFLGGAQRAPKIDFGGLWGPFESPLGSPFGHVGGSVEPLGHHLGPKWSQKRQHEGLKSDLGSSRGGQGVPEALQGSILEGILNFFGPILVCFWSLFSEGFRACRSLVSHGFSMFLFLMSAWLLHGFRIFFVVVQRGQGSAAGAAEDHMTCLHLLKGAWDH